MEDKIINRDLFKKSKKHVIWAMVIGFFALVGAIQFVIQVVQLIFSIF